MRLKFSFKLLTAAEVLAKVTNGIRFGAKFTPRRRVADKPGDRGGGDGTFAPVGILPDGGGGGRHFDSTF